MHAYIQARGWTLTQEYIDAGISGATDRRPALDQLVHDARRRRFDVLVVWRLDRLGRSLRHLVTLMDELHALGIAFVSLGEGIDFSTPAGRLQFHVLSALSEFERARIGERVRAAHGRARAHGTHIGRPRHQVSAADVSRTAQLSVRAAAKALHVSPALVCRLRSETLPQPEPLNGPKTEASAPVDRTVHKHVTL
ncbi:MAG: recombinase family protein [Vicinamibacterales bacterium]